jgi:REP element-mobilizing transposase RayT
MQKQKSFFKTKPRKEHGGALSVKKRRSRRPLGNKAPLHITLRSKHAKGVRSLLRHRKLINKVLLRSSQRFSVRVYKLGIVGNHIHLSIYGKDRLSVQNFFRVVAGHIAQGILQEYPLPTEGGAPKEACKKNQRRFWDLLIYSRVLTWGREFRIVNNYILRNALEALNIIAYKPRKKRAGGVPALNNTS